MHVIMIWRKPKSVERGRLDITLKITLHLEKVRVLEELKKVMAQRHFTAQNLT